MRLQRLARHGFLLLPVAFVTVFLVLPLILTIVVSFWKRSLLKLAPAFILTNYTDFLSGTRLTVLGRSFLVSVEATAIGILIAYPIAYFLARKAKPETTRVVLLLFTVPFLINYIIRAFAWTYLLGRTGPINTALMHAGLTRSPVDWLLYSDFAVLVGMVSSYMPFMIFPLWLSIAGIDRRLIEASWMLGAAPVATFLKVTLPLSLPGIFAAIIFSFVGCFGESAVPSILGGVGYQLIGNEITWRSSIWLAIGFVLLILYLPLVPPLFFSFAPETSGDTGLTLRWYAEMWQNPLLTGAMWTSLEAGVIVGAVTPILALAAAMAIRELRAARLILLVMLLPLFIPGVSMGLATAFFFRIAGISPSLLTIAIVQILWALPFATLVLLTAMSTFDPVYLEAAYMSGANRCAGAPSATSSCR